MTEHVELLRVLLSHGVPIDDFNAEGRSPLHQAVILDNGEMVSLLLEKGANAKLADKHGCLPIHLAAQFASAKAMTQLCEYANDDDSMFYAKDSEGRTAANIAIQNASEALNIMYRKGPPTSSGSKLTILHEVSRDGIAEIVQFLLADKASLSLQDADGRTALHHAVEGSHEEVACLLIEGGIDLESKDSSGFTALAKASCLQNLALLKLLVDSGADMNTRQNYDSWTPAHEAAAHGKVDILEYLVKAGADQGTQSATGKHALHLAIKSDCLPAVQMLLTLACPLDEMDNKGITPLIEAVQGQKVEMAKILLKAGAAANYSHKQERLALIEASHVGNVELIKLLISYSANVNEKNFMGDTALHRAAEMGKESVARLLISEGAEPAAKNKNSLLPLHFAARNGHIGVAELLLSILPDTEILTKSGKTPLLMAAWFQRDEFIRFLATKQANLSHKDTAGNNALLMTNFIPSDLKSVSTAASETLLDLGMDVNSKNSTGLTPLMYAISNAKSPDLVELYLSRGADPNASIALKSGFKKSVLMFAVEAGQPARIINLLRQHGANFRTKNGEGNLLQDAAYYGNDQVIETILQVTPNLLNEPGEPGLTPLQMACEFGHGKVIEKLLEMGADINAMSPKANFAPPIYTAAMFCQPESVRILARRGANLNTQSQSTKAQKTPLLVAIEQNNPKRIETMEALLKGGALVDMWGGDDWFPVHAAAKFGRIDALEMLVKYGANLVARIESNNGVTALHLAVLNKQVSFARALLSKGFPINVLDKNGATALMYAVQMKQPEMWDLLLATPGCNASLATSDGWTALQFATKYDEPQAIRSIFRVIAATNADTADFGRALHVAAGLGLVEATKALLSIVKDPCVRNHQGCSPLMVAVSQGHVKVIKLFSDEVVRTDRMAEPACTALHLAAASGERDIVVAILLKAPSLFFMEVNCKTAKDIALANNKMLVHGLLSDIQKYLKPGSFCVVGRWELHRALDEAGVKY